MVKPEESAAGVASAIGAGARDGGVEWLTVQEAAARTGKSETGIRMAITRGRLPETIRFGRKLIDAADLAAYIAQAKRGRPFKEKHG